MTSVPEPSRGTKSALDWHRTLRLPAEDKPEVLPKQVDRLCGRQIERHRH